MFEFYCVIPISSKIFKDWLLNELTPEKRSGQSGPKLEDSWATYWDNLDPIDESDFQEEE